MEARIHLNVFDVLPTGFLPHLLVTSPVMLSQASTFPMDFPDNLESRRPHACSPVHSYEDSSGVNSKVDYRAAHERPLTTPSYACEDTFSQPRESTHNGCWVKSAL